MISRTSRFGERGVQKRNIFDSMIRINAAIVVSRSLEIALKLYLPSLSDVMTTLSCVANEIDHRHYQSMDVVAFSSISVGIISISLFLLVCINNAGRTCLADQMASSCISVNRLDKNNGSIPISDILVSSRHFRRFFSDHPLYSGSHRIGSRNQMWRHVRLLKQNTVSNCTWRWTPSQLRT